jgi:molybdopterin molybdotransferase
MTVSDAQQRILSFFNVLDPVFIPVDQCTGRILAQEITARENHPPFDNSSMDGFAVRSADLSGASADHPVLLRIVADIPAGAAPQRAVAPGEAARIMTGAPMPAGADAVVPVEDTDLYRSQPQSIIDAEVQIYRAVAAGDYVRPRGQDLTEGQVVLKPGRLLQPQDAGLLAMLGVASVPVYRKPKMALFSSGDELVLPADPLTPGKIRDTNTYTLSALAAQHGAEVLNLGIARDQPDDVRQRFEQAVSAGADLILTSAGVSVGAFDFVRAVVEAQGKLNFWRVNMRPGKPLAFGEYKGLPVIGLPGNPVSAYIGFLVFVLPALNKLAGLPAQQRAQRTAILAHPLESDGRESYLRAIYSIENGQSSVSLTGHQGSGNLHSLVLANALLIVPSGVKSLPAGERVKIWLLNPDDLPRQE